MYIYLLLLHTLLFPLPLSVKAKMQIYENIGPQKYI